MIAAYSTPVPVDPAHAIDAWLAGLPDTTTDPSGAHP
jgi:hypothetical protein